jgi:raffinose/stachyose/melibiose transport system substrate-binding protein
MPRRLIALITLLLALSWAAAQQGSLTIESWRNDDLSIWRDTIIPAFNAQFPDIEVSFAPTAPAEYNAVLNSKLEAGTAGDLITCRPFDTSLGLFENGHLASLSDLSADAFAELGVSEPTTNEEFLALLDAIQADGGYAPLVLGTNDQWEAATVGFQNIGPNYWQGEAGRLGLIDGSIGYDEGGFAQAFEALAAWQPYLVDGYQAVAYPDAQNLFTLGLGAIYPSGSWEISGFRAQADFEMGAFRPPPPAGQDTCYISDHTDIAMGVNAASPNAEAAMIFLEWMTTPEFAELYSNALPGFFSLSDHAITLSDPLAQEFLSWRGECESTIRSSYQILSRGTPNNENDLWNAAAQVLNGTLTPAEAATQVQTGLEAWYGPQQGN